MTSTFGCLGSSSPDEHILQRYHTPLSLISDHPATMSLAATSQPLNKPLHIKYIQDLDKVCFIRSALITLP